MLITNLDIKNLSIWYMPNGDFFYVNILLIFLAKNSVEHSKKSATFVFYLHGLLCKY